MINHLSLRIDLHQVGPCVALSAILSSGILGFAGFRVDIFNSLVFHRNILSLFRIVVVLMLALIGMVFLEIAILKVALVVGVMETACSLFLTFAVTVICTNSSNVFAVATAARESIGAQFYSIPYLIHSMDFGARLVAAILVALAVISRRYSVVTGVNSSANAAVVPENRTLVRGQRWAL